MNDTAVLIPHYFFTPTAYSYLHVVDERWCGSGDATARTYARRPDGVFVVARAESALLGTASVWVRGGPLTRACAPAR